MGNDYVGFAYAAIILVGGVIGFVKAGSVMSIVAASAFALLSGYAAYTENSLVMLVSSGVLLLVMGNRFVNSGKFMPAGLTAGLSFFIAARSLQRLSGNRIF